MTRIELERGRLEVLDLPGDAPAVVLLHEGLGSVRLWREFPAALAEATGMRVVAFSRFGHGDSDPPPRPRTPRFMHEEAHEVLPAVLRAMDIDEPLLVGHSDGASIALIHASAHPVRGVVAIAPHVFVEEMCLAEIREAKRAYEADGLRARMARHHRDPDAAFYGWNDVWLHPDFPDWDITEILPRHHAARCCSSRASTTSTARWRSSTPSRPACKGRSSGCTHRRATPRSSRRRRRR